MKVSRALRTEIWGGSGMGVANNTHIGTLDSIMFGVIPCTFLYMASNSDVVRQIAKLTKFRSFKVICCSCCKIRIMVHLCHMFTEYTDCCRPADRKSTWTSYSEN